MSQIKKGIDTKHTVDSFTVVRLVYMNWMEAIKKLFLLHYLMENGFLLKLTQGLD
jgi:hypothetical protein